MRVFQNHKANKQNILKNEKREGGMGGKILARKMVRIRIITWMGKSRKWKIIKETGFLAI